MPTVQFQQSLRVTAVRPTVNVCRKDAPHQATCALQSKVQHPQALSNYLVTTNCNLLQNEYICLHFATDYNLWWLRAWGRFFFLNKWEKQASRTIVTKTIADRNLNFSALYGEQTTYWQQSLDILFNRLLSICLPSTDKLINMALSVLQWSTVISVKNN